ncbi:hypothetical protein ACQEVC_08290 [Plantactinospora sp. CA-294935]|uniref:hypothetical protein n=1 Tax=Plantactinospora sp. CA-294935 TaxID=3240012 RepID=UPI0032625045
MNLKALAIAGILAASGMVAAVGPASAALSDCATDRMCSWGNNDYLWMLYSRPHGESNYLNFTGDKNDEMDSWANRSASHTGCMAEDANGGGYKQTMARNSNDNNVSPLNSDLVSSWRTTSGC